ncbi:phage head-tail joining protein [Afifella sp. YEN Y35]|uniref:phage head-tail joining protein n=1 Tax=Afifella sp. YEN Y35 TaxID=3388337 RepID=UPI0039DFAB7A
MSDPATLRARLDTLRELRAAGIRTTRFGEDEVTFKSDGEMAGAIADLERQLAAAEGRPSVQIVNIRNQRGW